MKKYTINEHKKDLNRFRLLNEYDFYVEEEETYEPELGHEGGEIITEEPPEGEAPEGEDMGGEELSDEGGEELPDEGGEELPDEGGEEFAGAEDMGGEELPEPEAMDEPLPEPEPMEDEVELDVTELVQGTEEAKAASDRATQQIEILMGKFDTLSQSLEKMSAINQKIDDLEHEIEKRNPTPQEKLEMQSLNSFPYNLKLTDYWSEKEGNYDAMGGQKEDEEYVLTQDEVDRDYNAIEVKDSFTNPSEDEFIKKKF